MRTFTSGLSYQGAANTEFRLRLQPWLQIVLLDTLKITFFDSSNRTHNAAVGVPADASIVVGVSTDADVPAFTGLHSVVDDWALTIVSVATKPTVANVLQSTVVVSSCCCCWRHC
jgi:hypothetical protein